MSNLREILENYKSKKYEFFNHPRPIVMADYERSIKETIDKFSKLKDVYSIYNHTGAGVLGISDLDLIIILDRAFKYNKGEDFNKKNLNPTIQYLADYILQEKDLFSKFYYRFHHRWAASKNTLKCVYGKEIEFEEISEEESYLCKVYYLAGVLFTKMPRDLIRSLSTQRISIRGLLQIIYTLKFTIILEGQITGTLPKHEWISFSQKFDEFRGKWFQLGDEKYQQLIENLIEATAISFEILEEFSNLPKVRELMPTCSSGNDKEFCGIFSGFKFFTIFYDQEKTTTSEALQLSLELNEKNKMRVLFLPSIFATYMWQLTKAGVGERSKYISQNLMFSESIPQKLPHEYIYKREDLFNQYINFLLSGNFLSIDPGDAQGVFGFYKGSSFKNFIMKILRDIYSYIVKIKMIRYIKNKNL
jgi:hypothetical protein